MALDPQTQAVMQEFQRTILGLQREVDALKRGNRRPQLAHSSLEDGQSIEARDESGATRARIGWLPDGTVGMVTEGGDPVSAPTPPAVEPVIGGLRVTWDGQLANDVAIPGDLDHMAVHVSTTSGFTPSADTYQGTIRREGGGGMLPVIPLPYQEHYVVLVPVTTGGIEGDPSPEAAATPVQVEGPDLTAGSVTAPIIAGGAVTADKLEAILVLASTIVGGIPGGARVELDQDGIRGYDDTNTLVFAIDSAGNAVFSGSITGSAITGSTLTIGDPGGTGNYGVIEETPAGEAMAQVISASTARAQLSATDGQAEFSAWGSDDPASPAAGMLAEPASAQLLLWSDQGLTEDAPFAAMTAQSGQARGIWQSPNGSRIRIRALSDWCGVFAAPEESTAGEPAISTDGALYAFRRTSGDFPSVTLQSPVVDTGAGANLRAMLFLDGTTSTRDHGGGRVQARHFTIGTDWDMSTNASSGEAGTLFLEDTHSMVAAAHAPYTEHMVANPDFATSGAFVDFAASDFPPIVWTTSWSGRTTFTINMAGINHNSGNSSIALGFRLSGGTTVDGTLKRAGYARSIGAGVAHVAQGMWSGTLQLDGITEYTLTPMYRISSGDATTAEFNLSFANSIEVENKP